MLGVERRAGHVQAHHLWRALIRHPALRCNDLYARQKGQGGFNMLVAYWSVLRMHTFWSCL